MTSSEIEGVFKKLGLETAEERKRILSQGAVPDFGVEDANHQRPICLRVWDSHETGTSFEEAGACAKLERDPQ